MNMKSNNISITLPLGHTQDILGHKCDIRKYPLATTKIFIDDSTILHLNRGIILKIVIILIRNPELGNRRV